MTPKQRVLKKFPDAKAYAWAGPEPWTIYAATDGAYQGIALNVRDKTAAQAWASAIKNPLMRRNCVHSRSERKP